MTATQPEGLDMTDEQLLAHFEIPGLNLEATLDAHDLGLLLGGIRALLSARKPAVPEGWKLVPVDPTELMAMAPHTALVKFNPSTVMGHPVMEVARECYRSMLAASPAAPAQSGEPVKVLDWLETEVTAISCRYHGDPSYDHDAYWMRDRVVKLLADARKVFAAPQPSQPVEAGDTDFMCVDSFAEAMKQKLLAARLKGRSGWQQCDPALLSSMLREHVEKGDPRDVANFCMMLWHLEKPIAAQPTKYPKVVGLTEREQFIRNQGYAEGFEANAEKVATHPVDFIFPPMPNAVVLHDKVGPLFDRLSMHFYASKCMRLAVPQPSPTAVVLDDERAALRALKRLETACDQRAALLTGEVYLAAEAIPGMRDALYELDAARKEACEVLASAASPQPVEQISPIIGTQAPFSNCRFKFCDLPGQCRDEGKCHHPAVPAAQPVEQTRALTDDVRDAARYRWLRQQQWETANMFVVTGSKSRVYLGTYCPSLELLDADIDAELTAAQPASGGES